ncbi:MFS general substrate transporter [Tothia fuscella]|uniref:MFS general substrate transporter n=1 Tax=Tothia fuscella TaxID=1048955 RepID=A0A9P4NNH0_9PEZI|nr:MFS general substrate transporter [Tothia fuscella]
MDQPSRSNDLTVVDSSTEGSDTVVVNDEISTRPRSPREKFDFAMAFISLSVVAFTGALDATILSVALPIVAKDLHLTTLESFWASICFLLSCVLFQPLHTALSHIFGRKNILYLCIAFFVAGSATVGCAKNATTLIIGRSIQGVGGGGLEALSEIILTDMTTLRERPKYLGLLGLMWASGSITGPIIGGVFAEYSSWRWIAWINLPLMGVALVLIPCFLTLATDNSSFREKVKRVDWIGMVLLFVGLTAVVVPLTWAGQLYPWRSFRTILPLSLGCILLVVFYVYEKYPPEPVFMRSMLVFRTSTMAFAGTFIHGILLWCLIFYLPLYLESVIQKRPLAAAISGLPLILTVAPMAIVSAIVVEWCRHYNWLNRLAWVLVTGGLGTMMLLGNGTSKAVYSGLQISVGVGAGILFTGLVLGLQASVSAEDVGAATGFLVFFRNLGSVFGVAIGSTVFSNEIDKHIKTLDIPSFLPAFRSGNAVELITDLQTIQMPSNFKLEVLEVYAKSFRMVWLVMTCISGIGLASSLVMKELSLEQEDLGQQAYKGRDRNETPHSEDTWLPPIPKFSTLTLGRAGGVARQIPECQIKRDSSASK